MKLYMEVLKLVPAFQRIHQFAGCLETPAHQHSLLADHGKSILEETSLVLCGRWRRRHCCVERKSPGCRCGELLVDVQAPPGWCSRHVNGTPSQQGWELPRSAPSSCVITQPPSGGTTMLSIHNMYYRWTKQSFIYVVVCGHSKVPNLSMQCCAIHMLPCPGSVVHAF
jgi:hypothetical protein